jgi:AcrR family transcriptional regulator
VTRKKQQTRRAIAEAAQRLFVERGFDAVTVAEVARSADVSEGTVFNYFPTKEDLFYEQMEAFEAALVEAVPERPAGESAVSAFSRVILERSRGLESEERADVIESAARVIGASPALQAREREIVARAVDSLAALIADETGAAGVEPWVVASALMGVQRALSARVRAAVLAGNRGPSLAVDIRAQAARAFALLERGLADYAVKPRYPGRPRARQPRRKARTASTRRW